MGVKVKGLKELKNAVKEFYPQIEKKVFILFLNEVKNNTPVKTGVLRNNWTGKRIQNGLEFENVIKYASHVEYGHKTSNGGFVEGRYMMTNAINKVNARLDEIVQGVIDDKFS